MAVNEIKKSARKQGVSFYEYGMYLWLTILLAFDVIWMLFIVLAPFGDDQLDSSCLFVDHSDAKSWPQH